MLEAALLHGGLVRRYLGVAPAENMEDFMPQLEMALALEKRELENLSTLIGNAVAKAFGAKN
ncbi:hypothetical protein [Desulfovibrio cuneatus]|uniref:hypothetical protein n=1 Tax=Desulfovibrio cuneatus TaxID=159728 RepID=UPI00041F4EED|nr:hypothetical protein [Desulfovibrio cuneatus]